MASYNTLKTYLDAYITTNNANLITGSIVNIALTDLLKDLSALLFDATRPYQEGQVLSYEDGTFGYELHIATGAVSAGAWNASNFTRLIPRREKVTASDTPYTGIEAGENTYSHNLGHADFVVHAYESDGKEIPIDLRAKSTTTFTIYSAQNYASAYAYVIETIIP